MVFSKIDGSAGGFERILDADLTEGLADVKASANSIRAAKCQGRMAHATGPILAATETERDFDKPDMG